MVELAKKACRSRKCFYTCDRSEVLRCGPFDCGLALFTLHDHPDKLDTLSWAVSCLKKGGLFALIDLTSQDLPFLTDRLRRGLARPAVCVDSRIDPAWFNKIVRDLSVQIVEYSLVVLDISFPSASDVLQYLEVFGIYDGMDLPLGLEARDSFKTRDRIQRVLHETPFPFHDNRVFATCLLKKL